MSPTDRRSTATDGGVDRSELPFETISPSSRSRGERYRSLLDAWLIAPAKIIWGDWRARVGGFIILVYILMGTVGVMLIPSTTPAEGGQLVPPFQSLAFPLGTDALGNDLFAQIVHATPSMLVMITSGAVFTTIMATIVGAYSGYKGGTVDRVLMTLTDVLLTIPGLPLVIVLAVLLQPRQPWVVGIVLTINGWAGLARSIRSQVLTLRNESFVEASRLMGISTPTIITKDIVPGLMPYITVNFVNSARGVIFSSVGLYFLGILPFSNSNWGVIMNLAYSTGGALYSLNAAHWLLAPMVTILIFSFGLILFAQGTDRIFNPRVRARHVQTDESSKRQEQAESNSSIHQIET